MDIEQYGQIKNYIGAVVLAAGLSKRMGSAKMLLPWGQKSVIQAVVQALSDAEIGEIVVVGGGIIDQIREELDQYHVRIIFNPEHQNGEMLDSLRYGLNTLGKNIKAALIVLGDQPGIETTVIQKIITKFHETNATIVVPSYNMHRGHPWLVDRALFSHLCNMKPPETMRNFLNQHQKNIQYVKVNTPSVIQDIDTPEDYQKNSPSQSFGGS